MKFRSKKILTLILIGLFAISFSFSSSELITNSCDGSDIFCGTGQVVDLDKDKLCPNGFYHSANPLAYLFQILFILFLISPPLIVILLCLIWKELKKRNEMK